MYHSSDHILKMNKKSHDLNREKITSLIYELEFNAYE